MLTLRPAAQRGHADHGWLDTHHTFSFASYDDPRHRGFRSLRVINEDRVAGGRGFGTHGHSDMEILSLVLEGQLEHSDSMDNGAVLEVGEVQYMSAGSGVRHSEFNPHPERPVRFYQVWIEPAANERGATPRYGQIQLDLTAPGEQPVAGDDAEIALRQDAAVRYVNVPAGEAHEVVGRRPHQWVQVLEGSGRIEGSQTLEVAASDGVAAVDEGSLVLHAGEQPLTALVFDLA